MHFENLAMKPATQAEWQGWAMATKASGPKPKELALSLLAKIKIF
jgi:hypothetical protein